MNPLLRHHRLLYGAIVLASVIAFSVQAAAQAGASATLLARLSGESQVPPTDSTGSGNLQGTLDTRTRVLAWTLTTHGLSGPAVGAALHGPALPGENAAAAVPLSVGNAVDAGRVTLTSAQVDDLLAGRWYVSVLTAANPAGEIRGQLLVAR